MIALVIVVLIFVLLGLGVVALAMRTGSKPKAQDARASRRSRKLAFAGTAVVALAFGIGVPALVLAYNSGDQSKAAPGGLELSAAQENGRRLFAKNCATCHALASANAVGRVGPILDNIIPPIADPKNRIAFVKDAIVNGRARGNGQMPKGVVDGSDANDVASFVAESAGR